MNAATDNNIKKSKGRPRVDSAPVLVRLSADQLAALDDWRRRQEDIPGRPEAIRRLLALGIANAYEFADAARTKPKRRSRHLETGD